MTTVDTIYALGDTAPDLTGTTNSDLTGATMLWEIKKPDGTTFTRAGTSSSPTTGVVALALAAGDLDQVGTYQADMKVTYSGGGIQTFGPDFFKVRQPAV